MALTEIKHVIDCVIKSHPETAQEITNMLNSFSYDQLEEYARIAKLVMGY